MSTHCPADNSALNSVHANVVAIPCRNLSELSCSLSGSTDVGSSPRSAAAIGVISQRRTARNTRRKGPWQPRPTRAWRCCSRSSSGMWTWCPAMCSAVSCWPPPCSARCGKARCRRYSRASCWRKKMRGGRRRLGNLAVRWQIWRTYVGVLVLRGSFAV